MKKATYQRKLELVMQRNTPQTTLAEMKKKKAVENELKRFWNKEAARWMEENHLHMPVKQWITNWHEIRFDFNLKAGGTIIAKLYAADFNWREGNTLDLLETVRIPKKELLLP